MKIVSWNCNGKFREKHRQIQDLDADIYVIQECENPDFYKKQFADFYKNYIWYGENKNRGLGIFAKPNISIEKNDWPSYCLRYFLPVKVNGSFDLLAVWAGKPYIEEYYIYQAININRYNEDTVIIGDFNSNAKWDRKHGIRDHSAVTEQLREIGLVSAYHYVTGEIAGQERMDTFYLYRHLDKGYHIDYCFLNPSNLVDFQVLSNNNWLAYSDHIPIQVIIKP